jgi:DNA-binding response OmpR family regulator
MLTGFPSTSYVLVVEGSPDERDALVAFLEDAGYESVGAPNGELALAYLRAACPPMLIVLDLIIPVLDGWQLLEVRKQDATLRAIPVIVLSACVFTEGLEAVAACLRKPVDGEELVSTIEALTGRKRSAAPQFCKRH